jgi:hypothetical protein
MEMTLYEQRFIMKQNFSQCSFGELLARYMSQKNRSEDEVASQIAAKEEKGLKLVDEWLNDRFENLRSKHIVQLSLFFGLTDEQENEWFCSAGFRGRFCKLLDFYMYKKGIKNCQLATQLGVAPITVTRWIDEIVKRPGCESVGEAANILGLTPKQRYEFFLSTGCAPVEPFERDDENTNKITPTEKINKNEVLERSQPIMPIPGIPISHPCQFFGRADVLQRVRRAWNQPTALQHVAIIGKRRSGKTSFLKYLPLIAQVPPTDLRSDQPQGWNDWLPQDFQFAFVDFQLAVMSQPESLLSNILTQLNLKIPTPCNLITFSNTLDEQLKKPTVILMDEVGAGLRSPDLDAVFWSNMRALGNNCAGGKLGLVVTAHESLHKLATDSSKESPFFNIFGQIAHLKPLTEKEAQDLVNSFSLSLTEEDTDWILQNSGCWPALIQLICNERLQALESDTGDNWKDEALDRIEPFLGLRGQNNSFNLAPA